MDGEALRKRIVTLRQIEHDKAKQALAVRERAAPYDPEDPTSGPSETATFHLGAWTALGEVLRLIDSK
jgi:hypothetical protein